MIKSYVRLSSDSDIIYSGSDIQYFLIQCSFEYFTTSVRISVQIGFGYGFRYRVKCPPLSSWVELYNTNRDNVLVKILYNSIYSLFKVGISIKSVTQNSNQT